jgi:hypothetical protein
MAVNARSGAVALNVSTGNQVVSGLGFAPKLVLFQSTPDTSNIVSSIANSHYSYGAFDGVNQGVAMSNARNGVSTTDNQSRMDNAHVILVADPAGTSTVDFSAAGVSLDADGFTINVDNAPPINYRMGYIALGGSDIANVKVGSFLSKGSVGSLATTGIGFQPDVVIVFSSFASGSMPVSMGDAMIGMGFANSILSVNQYAAGSYSLDGTTGVLNSCRAQAQGDIVCTPTSGTVVGLRATLTSLDADGFTLNWTVHNTVVQHNLFYIAIKGGAGFQSSVNNIQLSGTTSASVTKTGLAFQGGFGLFTSAMTVSNNASTLAGGGLSLGFVDDLKSHFNTSSIDRFSGTVGAYHTSHDARIERYIAYFSSALLEEASLSAWNSNGYTLFMNKGTGGTGNYIGSLIMNATAPVPPSPSSDVYGFMV